MKSTVDTFFAKHESSGKDAQDRQRRRREKEEAKLTARALASGPQLKRTDER